MVEYKYDEDLNLKKVLEYIELTYGQHYVGREGTQIQDLLNAIGISENFCQGNAVKYISRYGRKNGKNEQDLLKAMHYILLLMHFSEKNNGEKT